MLKSLLIVGATGAVVGGIGFLYGRYKGYRSATTRITRGMATVDKLMADLDKLGVPQA